MSDAAAICTYCREPLNPGATACRACGRRQPVSAETRKGLGKALIIIGAIVPIAAGVWLLASQSGNRDAAIQQAANVAAFCGRTMQRPAVEEAMDKFRASAASWAEAGRMFSTTYGCLPK